MTQEAMPRDCRYCVHYSEHLTLHWTCSEYPQGIPENTGPGEYKNAVVWYGGVVDCAEFKAYTTDPLDWDWTLTDAREALWKDAENVYALLSEEEKKKQFPLRHERDRNPPPISMTAFFRDLRTVVLRGESLEKIFPGYRDPQTMFATVEPAEQPQKPVLKKVMVDMPDPQEQPKKKPPFRKAMARI